MGVHTEHYRAEAEYCEAMAEKAQNTEAKADWLRLAVKWLALASGEPVAPRSAEADPKLSVQKDPEDRAGSV